MTLANKRKVTKELVIKTVVVIVAVTLFSIYGLTDNCADFTTRAAIRACEATK